MFPVSEAISSQNRATREPFVEKLHDIRKHIDEIEKEKTGKRVRKERVILKFAIGSGEDTDKFNFVTGSRISDLTSYAFIPAQLNPKTK
jgi:hypothetical protein